MHVSIYPTMHSASPGLLLLSILFLADADSSPRFTRTPEDQTGVQGGVASFVCQAAGDPQPKIMWNKKGKRVSNQRFEVIEFDDGSGSVLRIQPLRTPRDEAIYECHASNSAGEITASTRLSVLREDQLPPGFPTIDMGPQLKVVERSRTATMLCAASGNPDPEISWFKDFLPVNTSSNNGRIKQLRSGNQNFDNFLIFLFPNSSFFFLTLFLIPILNLLLLQTMILILLIFNPCFLAAGSPSCVVASCDILADFVCCCCDTSWLCMIPNPSILYQTF
uniref:Protein tyrosine phosphatase receptor type D n=1 Tax=Oryzias latipes TaxID=8090 RepID=A0A3P9IZ76_ORYLA